MEEGTMVRKPYVAGQFYPGQRGALEKDLASRLIPEVESAKAVAVVSPHAGYMYSGGVAGAVYSSVKIPDRIVLLGPDHRGQATDFALMVEGAWSTPLGEVPLDSELGGRLLKTFSLASDDRQAHSFEHSLEVQVPFLQYLNPRISILPVSIPYFASLRDLTTFGRTLADAVRSSNSDVLLVASTDMSHQVSQATAREKDFIAIDRILALDAEGLFQVVRNHRITMCGFQATTAVLSAAVELGAERAELIRYQTSGDITGDYDAVVGYAGLRIL
jgi:AmmeMemoRadiSam system protein B